jgi:hypothetical protein
MIAVVIIGKRYGDPTPTGFGVTHNEFRTARENGIPTIGFVENEVLSFKRVAE